MRKVKWCTNESTCKCACKLDGGMRQQMICCQCDLQNADTGKPLNEVSVGSELSAKELATLHQGHWHCNVPGLAFSLAHSQRRVLYSKLVDTHAGLHMFLTAARYTTTALNVDCAVVAIFLQVLLKGSILRLPSAVHLCITQHFLNTHSFCFFSISFSLYRPRKKALLGNCFTSVLAIATVRDLKFQSSHLPAYVFFV